MPGGSNAGAPPQPPPIWKRFAPAGMSEGKPRCPENRHEQIRLPFFPVSPSRPHFDKEFFTGRIVLEDCSILNRDTNHSNSCGDIHQGEVRDTRPTKS